MTRLSPLAGAFFACALLILSPTAAVSQAAPLTPALVEELRFRSVGPAVAGGRIHDVEALPDNPATLYVASASGGIWKSVNKGTTWEPIFEHQAVSTFGDLAIAPSNPRVIWAGTGEQNNRQSTSWGNGVYRSMDGGTTWTHLGLEETRHIGRVQVHPDNPDIAYVAALGNLWKPSSERGVFKTSDGGRSWTKVLYVDTLTGVVDLVMDPRDPNTLYAAAYQRLRQPWGFNGGGAGSGILKTTDGGKTWTRLTNGIPAGDKGRIGLAIAASDPRVLNATIEHATEGGTYRTQDGGQTWTKVNALNPRPMYYSHIFIDPTNANRVYILAVEFYRSEDGGRTFREMPTRPTYDVGVHSDHHSLWINPANPEHFFLAGDGGLHESWDGGETYDRINNIPIGQFYAIGADMREPYFIYGGMQDNHSWMGPSATRSWIGIINDEWRQIGFGDGMYQQPDPTNHRYVYTNSQNGNLTRLDAETGDLLELEPTPPPGEPPYRWDWATPSLVSRHDPKTVYFGGNRLFISRDRGASWERTEDLTRQVNRDTLRLMGVMGSQPMLSKHDGEETFSEITTISESPLEAAVLWVGTDDGNVQVSRDGGRSWTEVGRNVRGVPSGTYVSRVLASAASPGTAYVTFDAHRSGDFAPYVFRTTDFGQRWTAVVGGLPSGSVNVIAEHPANPQVLFLGTEHALWVSPDAGRGWTRLGANLPTTLFDDLLVHPRDGDLVVGTHGRSIWILDDAAPLAEWSPKVAAAPAHLFGVRPASIFQYWKDTSYRGQSAFAGENPPHGAILSYYLARPASSAQITIADSAGRVVRRLDVPAEPGAIRRAVWDLRHEPPPAEPEGTSQPQPSLPHSIAARGPFVSPGTYTATLQAGDARATQKVLVRGDPRMPLSDAQHREREAFLLEVAEMQREVFTAAQRARTLRAGLAALRDSAGAGVTQLDSVTVLEDRLGGRSGRGGLQGQIYSLAGDFNGGGVRQGSLYPPTETHRRRKAELQAELRELQQALERAEAMNRQPGSSEGPFPR